MQKKIKNINWQETPATREWKRQHQEKTDNVPCKHLKKVWLQQVIDKENDNVEYYNICEQCKEILSEEDMKKREDVLKTFKKL